MARTTATSAALLAATLATAAPDCGCVGTTPGTPDEPPPSSQPAPQRAHAAHCDLAPADPGPGYEVTCDPFPHPPTGVVGDGPPCCPPLFEVESR